MQEFARKLCPLCGTRQRLELNAGVQIFYCPQCRAKQCWDSNVLNSPIMLMQEDGSTVVPPVEPAAAAKAGSVGTGAHEQPMSRPKKIAWAIFTLVMMAVLLPKELIPENLIPQNLLPDINVARLFGGAPTPEEYGFEPLPESPFTAADPDTVTVEQMDQMMEAWQ
ncbi:hypothetical protein [Pseudidiomarina gelatinasegens]|uniref:hypothetical protein n=1 Tax=Pseudidiomarina gelatinasegens TaxID=2487740 RepID=UPI003A97A3D0